MTHTKISESAEKRRAALVKLSALGAIKACIDIDSDAEFDLSTNDNIANYLIGIELHTKSNQYFSEATVAKQTDPIALADRRIKNGMKMSGKNVDINMPPNWSKLIVESRNFRYKMHAWGMLDTLLSADEVSDCDEYLLKSIGIANDWIDRHIIQGAHDEFAWYDMATGHRATKLAYMLRRLISIGAPIDTIKNFIITCEIHIIELTQENRIATHSNHGLFQIGGLIALCCSIPWFRKSKGGHSFSIQILTQMLDEHFSEDGLHKEHSPEYHYFMVTHLSSFISLGWVDEVPELRKIVQLVENASWWMQNPENNVIAIGDSKNNLPAIERWGRISTNLLDGLMTFPSGGLVIENVRNKDMFSQLVFAAQFHSRQHKHADHLNVLYHLNNQPILVDSGSYTYQYDLPERIYCESTRAHNTVEIDGLNHSRFRQDAFGSALTMCTKLGPCTLLSGKVNHTRLISSFIPNNKIKTQDGIDVNIEHIRTLIHYPNRFLAIVDQMNSDNPHDYIQWNHFSPEINIQEFTPHRYELYNNEDRICVVFSVDEELTPLEPVIVRGQTQPHLQGWISHNGVELKENTALGFNCKGGNKIFLTVFDFSMKNTGKPYLRSGSDGNYLRFALSQEGSKVDLKFRHSSSGQLVINAMVDDIEYTEEVSRIGDL